MSPKKPGWKKHPMDIPPPDAAPITQGEGTILASAMEAHEEHVAEQHHHHHHPGGDPMKADTCANCKFAQAHEVAGQVYCKRNPPTPVSIGLSVFPILVESNWCGEWQQGKAA